MPTQRPLALAVALAAATAAVVATLASPAGATQTQFFKIDTRDAFKAGTLGGLIVTNFGELRLGRRLDPVLRDDGKYASVDALVEASDGTVYVGTSAAGKLLVIKDDKPTEIADFGEADGVTALALDAGGNLLIGVSGERAAIHILRHGAAKPEPLVTLDEDTHYVWAIATTPDNAVFAATGPAGKLYRVDPENRSASVLYDSDEENLRCVAPLNDTLFVGTDPHGLILKIDRASGKAFVVYDAPETEVGTMLIDSRNGQLYAATCQIVEAAQQPGGAPPPQPQPPQQPQPATEGRPAGGGNGGGADDLPGNAPVEPPTPPADAPRPGELRPDAAAAPEPPTGGPPSSQPAGASTTTLSPSGPRPMTPRGEDDEEAEVATNGNAVYRIDSQGFVSEVFRESGSMIFGLARRDDDLLIATGPTGTLYQLNLASEEHTAVAQTRARMLTSLLLAADGRAWLGSSDSAELTRLSAELVKSGTFTSAVLDATQISAFGKVQARGTVPEGTTMTLSARSSNVGDADSPLWSDWSEPVPAARFASVPIPAARYAQIRATLTGDEKRATPSLGALELAYARPNVAPRIESVAVTTPAAVSNDEPGPRPTRQVQWTAADANGDAMRFTVSVRNVGANEGWTTIARDVAEATYDWDTRRNRDGRYEVKVEASDALANAPGTGRTASRISDAVVVDNTAPTIGDVTQTRDNGKVRVGVHVVDRGGGIVSRLEYRVDDARDWQTVTASDNLDDSPDERYAIELPDAGDRTRTLSLRGRDDNGNMAYESVTIPPAK